MLHVFTSQVAPNKQILLPLPWQENSGRKVNVLKHACVSKASNPTHPKKRPARASTDPFFGDQHEQPRAALHTSGGTKFWLQTTEKKNISRIILVEDISLTICWNPWFFDVFWLRPFEFIPKQVTKIISTFFCQLNRSGGYFDSITSPTRNHEEPPPVVTCEGLAVSPTMRFTPKVGLFKRLLWYLQQPSCYLISRIKTSDVIM